MLRPKKLSSCVIGGLPALPDASAALRQLDPEQHSAVPYIEERHHSTAHVDEGAKPQDSSDLPAFLSGNAYLKSLQKYKYS